MAPDGTFLLAVYPEWKKLRKYKTNNMKEVQGGESHMV